MKVVQIIQRNSKRIDLAGKVFGKLTVIDYVKLDNGKNKWRCRCECGKIAYIDTGHLNAGQKSCGCEMNLVGQRFGKVIVLEKTDKRNRSNALLWKCRCDCGNECLKSTSELRSGFQISCGCNWRQSSVQRGERYGRLTTLRPTEQRQSRSVVWECLCDCGKAVSVRASLLTNGHTTSCGCYKTDLQKEHGIKEFLTYTDDTCIEFLKNIGKPRINTSSKTRCRGVVFRDGKYIVTIHFKNQRYYLGRYDNLDDAIRIRKMAEERVDDYVKAYDEGNATIQITFDDIRKTISN